MATQQQIYETKILLNSEQAKKEITALEKKVDELKRKRQQALDAGDTKSWTKLNKEVTKYETKLGNMRNRLEGINKTLGNMSAAGPKQLKDTIKDINALLNSGTIERGSRQWEALTANLKSANGELRRIKQETNASVPALQKFFKFLNDSWGGVVILYQSITGMSMTIRKSVEDYAKMEEAMADTRKYTGLTDTAIRELNEDLKKMDTRTSREELNELAGAAGRLGKTSRQEILDFVEAGNMIKVALGDDLGEGAIDKVGKLAMAFGEDERMGLRGAMLATGSAINELAQNSSAQAGYLVDFTARVAGFGKQLGLTQAQIMGFGAVMDENLLRDEMAATAFGNMLTKMQTDTAKFARIAGQDVREFTDLLNRDANAAILALADNLRKADPQNMMKMLDDMGLDGSRAVGVLSTMADKIDDVRARQELATEAYKEGTSVGKEYDTMNSTVEAGIEKCKKQFHEMTVELGEQLLPVVKYTISTTSLLAKAMSGTLGFIYQNAGAITKLAVLLAEYVAIQKLHYLWTQRSVAIQNAALALDKAQMAVTRAMIGFRKAHTIAMLAHNGAISKAVALQRIWNEVLRKNPIGLAVTAVALLTAGIWKLVSALRESGARQRIVNDLYGKAAEKVAEEKAEISQLLRVARDEKEQLDKRKEAIEKLNDIIPGYNGQLNETTGKYTENAAALQAYNTLLKEKYRLEAAEDKLKELEKKRFKEDLDYEEKMRQSQEREAGGGTALTRWAATQGPQAEGSVSEKAYQEQITRDHEKQNAVLQKQIDIVTGIRDATKEVVDFNDQLNSQMEEQKKKLEGTKKEEEKPTASTPYKSEKEEKKETKERKRREAEQLKAMREQSRQLKAETDQRLADEALGYSVGLTSYRDYIEKRREIQLEGIRQRKALFQQGSTEYLRLDAEEKQLLIRGDEEQRKMTLKEYERMHKDLLLELERDFNTEGSAIYHNEDALREARFQEEMDYLENKKSLTRKGSLEEIQIEWEIQDRSKEHQTEREREYMERLSRYREEMGRTNYQQLQEFELKGIETIYGALVRSGQMTKDEYDAIVEHIKRKYAELEGGQTADNDIEAKASKALDTARKKAGVKEYGTGGDAATGVFSIATAVQNQAAINEQLKQLYGQDYENNREYQEAKRQLDTETMQGIVAGAQAAYQTISQFMSAASGYAQACSDLEVARITANYDKQIEAAGKNSKKKERLEKERDKKIAEAKTKANKKAMAMEIAQAVAQTAMGAISAYSSTMAGAPYPANLVLAPISAGIALAAGALQIATIKKQHEAEAAGYYEGGFTGGRRYHRRAGVVHEGEFVANHQAVQNPAILPFLNFIDQAQRNNTVGSLTAEDVSRSMGAGGTAQVVAPVVNVQSDNEELRDELERSRETIERLAGILDAGIVSYSDTEQTYKALQNLKRIKDNA